MNQATIEQAHKNIRLFFVLKIFTKRVFFPIVPIFFVTQLGLTIQEIGLVSVLFAAVSIVSNVPAGYFADRFGRANSIRLMALIQIVATLCYFFAYSKGGAYIAIAIEALGYAFYIGAGEALVHDSLEVTKQEKQYTKIVSRAQSFALIINAGLVALIPMTYAINPRLPFLFGTLAFTALLITGFKMDEVLPLAKREVKKAEKFSLKSWRFLLKHYKIALFALLLGTVGTLYYSFDIFTIALKQFGFQPELLGWIFSASSLLGAAFGFAVHYLKRLKVELYMLLDVAIVLLPFIAIYSGNLWATIASVVVFMAFWRFRKIVYQHHAFERYPTRFKSTLVSALFMMEDVQGLWVPIAMTSAIAAYGMSLGAGYTALAIIAIALPFVILGHFVLGGKNSQGATAP